MEFDGTDFIVTVLRLDPAAGLLSVFAWIKGGAPGQVILSQQTGANWLMADALAGALRTELKEGGRLATDLVSESVITDGSWHRVGLVWDGSNRRLYVDSTLVAEDMQSGLKASSRSIIVGGGATATPGTYWTGQIDDVRIYNRVVKP
jgi:hypothetical protein